MQFAFLLTVFAAGAFAADPCFDFGPDPDTGNYALCVQEDSCITEPVAQDACPSFPTDYACCYHKTFPGREHRGVWIASVANIDWPISPTSSVATQQEELRNLIDATEDSGMNAIYLQMRPAGDALYQSDIEPWSRYLTGTQGTAPNPLWDPLQFAIDYAHPKNIEVHAWINPYRANLAATTVGLADNHMAKQIPECAHPYGTLLWMDPGCEAVQNWTYSVAMDIVSRYDVDGLHMDDYFYPYKVSGVDFPDSRTYAEYIARGGSLLKDDWRRENVNILIRRLNDGVHTIKPWVVFSVSPFGIYRPGHPDGMPSPPITGMDQYAEIYCDAKLWIKEGWLDVLIPQLYWRIAPPAQSYPTLLDWWVAEGQNPQHHRHVYAGNYLSRIDPGLDDWSTEEIRLQIDISREPQHRLRGSWGNVQFSAKIIRDNLKNMRNYFKYFIYPLPALQPVFPWMSNATYAEIENVSPLVAKPKGTSVTISLDERNNNIATEIIHKIAIYKDNKKEWDLVKIVDLKSQGLPINLSELLEGNYAVSFVNRFGQESRKTKFSV